MSISARFGISAVALLRALMCAAIVALIARGGTTQTTAALGRPGVTPVPCPDQAWQISEASFDALPGAKVSFGQYSGGLYRIEIPEDWNGDLVLYAHGFVSNAGANGS